MYDFIPFASKQGKMLRLLKKPVVSDKESKKERNNKDDDMNMGKSNKLIYCFLYFLLFS